MATLTKKLNILPNGGGQVSCSIYSTTTEVGANYVPTTVDGVNGYIPIGSTSDTRATKGRVSKSSTEYAILTSAKPAYTEKAYTTVGTHTFTVPEGVSRIRVAVCGGGSGGIVDYGDTAHTSTGGTSSFGDLITATGGKNQATIGQYTTYNGKTGNTYTGYKVTSGSSVGGTPNGKNGVEAVYNNNGKVWAYGSGFALGFTMADGSYGKGGDCYEYYYSGYAFTGSSGGYNTGYFNVTPGTTYSITVGAGGQGYYYHHDYGIGYAGTSGFVLVAYGGDI